MDTGRVFDGEITASPAHLPPDERPIWPGTSGPASSTPPRAPRSVRRTSSVDILAPGGLRSVELHGIGRDLLTGDDPHETTVIDEATLFVTLEGLARGITSARLTPHHAEIEAWLATTAGHFRFRKQIEQAWPDFVAGGTIAALLVDEIPGAALISGAALGRLGMLPARTAGAGPGPGVDVCAGWIEHGSMHVGLTTKPFFGEGPPAPSLDCPGDLLAWHGMPVLEPTSMRRRRRIDVARISSTSASVEVLFRDSYVEPDGSESVVHEYGLSAEVDLDNWTVTAIRADAHVLPSPECPAAAASAQRVVGRNLAELRALVRDEFRGTSTCTHLNDSLRSLGDVGALIDALP